MNKPETMLVETSLSVRIINLLLYGGVASVGNLCSKTNVDLLMLPNFGVLSLREVERWLSENSLQLRSASNGSYYSPAALKLENARLRAKLAELGYSDA